MRLFLSINQNKKKVVLQLKTSNKYVSNIHSFFSKKKNKKKTKNKNETKLNTNLNITIISLVIAGTWTTSLRRTELLTAVAIQEKETKEKDEVYNTPQKDIKNANLYFAQGRTT